MSLRSSFNDVELDKDVECYLNNINNQAYPVQTCTLQLGLYRKLTGYYLTIPG